MRCKLSAAVLAGLCAINAQAADLAAGKTKASACIGCHGANGIGLSDEFPNLAGQKAAYLARQLKAFRSGERRNPTMQAMAKNLSDTDIEQLSAWFASLSPKPGMTAEKPAAGDRAGVEEFPAPVFITMKKSGTVERFPAEIQWAGGPNMLYDAVTPDGTTLLATSPSSDSVYVFDTATGKQRAIIAVGKAPKGIKVAPDGRLAYASNEGSAEISVIDLVSLKVIDSISVEEGPHNVRFTQDGKRAYVTLQGGAGIGVIDTRARKQIRVIPVPGITGPHNIDLSADEKTAYVRDFVHHVAVLDLDSGKVKRVIKVGNGHGGIDVSPDGRFIATAAIGADFISVIDPETYAVTNITVGQGPHGIRTSKDGRWLYVTVTGENRVAVIDTRSLQVIKQIPVGEFPFWVAVKDNP